MWDFFSLGIAAWHCILVRLIFRWIWTGIVALPVYDASTRLGTFQWMFPLRSVINNLLLSLYLGLAVRVAQGRQLGRIFENNWDTYLKSLEQHSQESDANPTCVSSWHNTVPAGPPPQNSFRCFVVVCRGTRSRVSRHNGWTILRWQPLSGPEHSSDEKL